MNDEEKDKKEDAWDGLKEFLTKAEKRLQEQKEKEEKAKKKSKIIGGILKWYVIIAVIFVTFILLALLGKGLYEILAVLFHGFASTFA